MHPQEEGEYNLDKNSPCPLNGKVKQGKVRPERSWTTIDLGRQNTALRRRWRKYSVKEECVYVSKMKAAKAMVIMLQKVITKRNCHPPQRSSKILIMKWNSVCVSANRHRSASLSKTSTRVLDVLRRNVMVCFFVSKSCFQCVFNVFGFSELFL